MKADILTLGQLGHTDVLNWKTPQQLSEESGVTFLPFSGETERAGAGLLQSVAEEPLTGNFEGMMGKVLYAVIGG